jgi:hypothetical protein
LTEANVLSNSQDISPTSEALQQDATTSPFINLFKSALHVSGNKFAHPQEHFLTAYIAFGTLKRT